MMRSSIDTLREKVYKDLWNVTKHALERDAINEEQGGEIADFILEQLDILETEPELLSFLRKLAEKWEMFSNVYLLIQSEIHNQANVESLKAQLHQS